MKGHEGDQVLISKQQLMAKVITWVGPQFEATGLYVIVLLVRCVPQETLGKGFED